jgi:hypothetical protein
MTERSSRQQDVSEMFEKLDFAITSGYNFVANASVAQWQSSGFVKRWRLY